MYYRYRSGNSSNVFLKFFVPGICVLLIGFALFHFRSRLMFWKFSIDQLSNEIDRKNESGLEGGVTLESLEALLEKSQQYIEKKPLAEEGYLSSSRVYRKLGELVSGVTFTSYVIGSGNVEFSEQSQQYFQKAIVALKKGVALEEENIYSDANLVLLSILYYYTGYYDDHVVDELILSMVSPETLSDVELRRFYGFILVRMGEVEKGVLFLKEHGDISTFAERLFLASVYNKAGQYTDAINSYKVLMCEDEFANYEYVIRYNLGLIYYKQTLYSEALRQFEYLMDDFSSEVQLCKVVAELNEIIGDAGIGN